jgi:hypothetical protein
MTPSTRKKDPPQQQLQPAPKMMTELPDGYESTTQHNLAVALAVAEVDQQITTAHAYPRSIERAMKNILALATLDEQTAAECIYALPRGNKPIKGPSIRLAEIIQGQWGNNRVGARVTHVDRIEKFVEAEGVFHDLETNAATTARIRRRLSDKEGRLLNEDMIQVTSNAACAIAKRNAILGAVPKAIWRRAYQEVERVLIGDVRTLVTRRDDALKAFAGFGIKPEQLFAKLEIEGLDDIGPDEYTTLLGMFQAIKNNETSVEEMFPPEKGKYAADRPGSLKGRLDKLAGEDQPKATEKAADAQEPSDDDFPGDMPETAPAAASGGGTAGVTETETVDLKTGEVTEKPAMTWSDAISWFMGMATDTKLPDLQERLQNLDLARPNIEDVWPAPKVKVLFDTAVKVARGEQKPDQVRKYLESL